MHVGIPTQFRHWFIQSAVAIPVLVKPSSGMKRFSLKATVLCSVFHQSAFSLKATVLCSVFHQSACCTPVLVNPSWSKKHLSYSHSSLLTCSFTVQGFLVSTMASPNIGWRYNNAHQRFQYITNHSRYMKYCSGILGPFAPIALLFFVCVCVCVWFFFFSSSPLPL